MDMKNLFLILFILAGCVTAAALTTKQMDSQKNTLPKRSKYTFRTQFTLNDSGEYIKGVTVEGWANGQKTDFVWSHELWTKQPVDNKVAWVKETDINFDGKADLLIYLGYFGADGEGGDVYQAFVWNDKQRRFEHVEEFNQLPDPVFNKRKKTISVDYQLDYRTHVTGVYKWEDGKLKWIDGEVSVIEYEKDNNSNYIIE